MGTCLIWNRPAGGLPQAAVLVATVIFHLLKEGSILKKKNKKRKNDVNEVRWGLKRSRAVNHQEQDLSTETIPRARLLSRTDRICGTDRSHLSPCLASSNQKCCGAGRSRIPKKKKKKKKKKEVSNLRSSMRKRKDERKTDGVNVVEGFLLAKGCIRVKFSDNICLEINAQEMRVE